MPLNAPVKEVAWHVTVEWANGDQPWLVFIRATTAAEARRLVEADVQPKGGKVVDVEKG